MLLATRTIDKEESLLAGYKKFEFTFTSSNNVKPKQVEMVEQVIEKHSEIGPRIKYPDQAPANSKS